ncbi:MAG: hypothetical protein HYU69_09445 [Bacteroidetes bacterium]|nr:hypothetical protein [Bacteroidota bacterium]MBL7891254.1 hypothetical protein [Bacteroidia bacterium]
MKKKMIIFGTAVLMMATATIYALNARSTDSCCCSTCDCQTCECSDCNDCSNCGSAGCGECSK